MFVRQDLRRKMVSPNVDLFLGKPVDLEDLKAAVHKLLKVHSGDSYIDCQGPESVNTIGELRNEIEAEHFGFMSRATDEIDV